MKLPTPNLFELALLGWALLAAFAEGLDVILRFLLRLV